jgi:hypothetical protein
VDLAGGGADPAVGHQRRWEQLAAAATNEPFVGAQEAGVDQVGEVRLVTLKRLCPLFR